MASVISLTETKIQELLNGWEGVSLSQDDINALITQLKLLVDSQSLDMEEFNEILRPRLEHDLSVNSNLLDDLLTNVFPDLASQVDSVEGTINLLQETTIPSMQQDLASAATAVAESPTVYVQATGPMNPDDNGRYLIVGDVWYDSDDNNTQRIWNGTDWTSFNQDVGDLTVTVKNFISGKHQIY